MDKFVILDLGVHMLDVARFLMGEASRLYCQTQSVKPGIRGEDMATIVLRAREWRDKRGRMQLCQPNSPRSVPAA